MERYVTITLATRTNGRKQPEEPSRAFSFLSLCLYPPLYSCSVDNNYFLILVVAYLYTHLTPRCLDGFYHLLRLPSITCGYSSHASPRTSQEILAHSSHQIPDEGGVCSRTTPIAALHYWNVPILAGLDSPTLSMPPY